MARAIDTWGLANATFGETLSGSNSGGEFAMRAIALAFAMTMLGTSAFASGCNYGVSAADTSSKVTVAAEAPQQTPVPSTSKTGS